MSDLNWYSDNDCKHGMNPDWCSTCKGLKTPEEEEAILTKAFDALLSRWGKKHG